MNFTKGEDDYLGTVQNTDIESDAVEKNDFFTQLNYTDSVDSMLKPNTVVVSAEKINNLNVILNDNDCGNNFFKKICSALEERGIQFQTSIKNDNIKHDNATIITIDQQMVAGENVALIGPYKNDEVTDSEALLKAMEVTFKQDGWETDALAGIAQYQPLENGDVVYTTIPSSTEVDSLLTSAQITVSFGTLRPGYTVEKIANDFITSLARYQYYLEYERSDNFHSEYSNEAKLDYDNHYIFHTQIVEAQAFQPSIPIEIQKTAHRAK